jgi:hypothetical protein
MKIPIPTPTKKIETIINEEMQRLAKISPLLSPTVGWPKLKGLLSIETKIDLRYLTKVNPKLEGVELWALEDSSALREEANRGMRMLLGTLVKMATDALKPAGWKLKAIDQQNSHHVAMLWTRKGRDISILSYIQDAAPYVIWCVRDGKHKVIKFNTINAYGSEASLVISTSKGVDDSLSEICAVLDKQMHARNIKTHLSNGPRESVRISDFAIGLSQVHVNIERDHTIVHPHHKLMESLRGKVNFVGFNYSFGGITPRLPTAILQAMAPSQPITPEAWKSLCKLRPGHIRLVALDEQYRMKWCETFGPDETVPKSTVKRLLEASKPWTHVIPNIEKHSVYQSIKQSQ